MNFCGRTSDREEIKKNNVTQITDGSLPPNNVTQITDGSLPPNTTAVLEDFLYFIFQNRKGLKREFSGLDKRREKNRGKV